MAVKIHFGTEKYLYVLNKKVFRDAEIKLRMGISELYIHKHRYRQNDFESLCPFCRETDEDEKALPSSLSALYDLRIRYLILCISWEEENPFVQLLSDSENVVIRGVATYLYHAFKRREEAIAQNLRKFFLE